MADLAKLVAADIMKRALIQVRPDASLSQVERELVEHRISGLPVVENNHLLGVVSSTDIARAQVLMETLDSQISDEDRWEDQQADGFQHPQHPAFHGFQQRLDRLTARDIMRSQVVTCTPTTPVTEVAAEMLRHHVHRIIVVQDDHPVGIIRSLDVVKLVADVKVSS